MKGTLRGQGRGIEMNCKIIQEFLITDYIDGQIEIDHKNLIDQHLAVLPVQDIYAI